MDWVGYNIFIGNGKEFGFDDDEEEEGDYEEISLDFSKVLEPLMNLDWNEEEEETHPI